MWLWEKMEEGGGEGRLGITVGWENHGSPMGGVGMSGNVENVQEGWEFPWNWLGKKGMVSICSQLLPSTGNPRDPTMDHHREGFGSGISGGSDGPSQDLWNSQKSTSSFHQDPHFHKSRLLLLFQVFIAELQGKSSTGNKSPMTPCPEFPPNPWECRDPPGSANSGSTVGPGLESPSQRDFRRNLGTWISGGLGSAGNSWIQCLKGLFQPKQFRDP